MQPRPHAVPAEEHDPEKTGFEKERRQDFIGQQGAGDAARELRKTAPVSAELIGHHQPGYHSHTEVDGEDLRPEMVQRAPGGIFAFQPQAFENRQVARQANGDSGKDNMKRDRKGELNSRQMECIKTEHAGLHNKIYSAQF